MPLLLVESTFGWLDDLGTKTASLVTLLVLVGPGRPAQGRAMTPLLGRYISKMQLLLQ